MTFFSGRKHLEKKKWFCQRGLCLIFHLNKRACTFTFQVIICGYFFQVINLCIASYFCKWKTISAFRRHFYLENTFVIQENPSFFLQAKQVKWLWWTSLLNLHITPNKFQSARKKLAGNEKKLWIFLNFLGISKNSFFVAFIFKSLLYVILPYNQWETFFHLK